MSIIRSTYHHRLSAARLETQRLGRSYSSAQSTAASGLKVEHASDDPGRVTRLHKAREHADDQLVWYENAAWAEGVLGTVDQALTGMAENLGRAHELAVEFASETRNDADRIRASEESQNLYEGMLDLLNTDFGGRYVFAGNAYDAPAYDSTGTYQGDAGEPNTKVAENTDIQIGFDGSDLLQGTGDVVAALNSLNTALAAGDATLAQAAIDELDDAIEQLARARTTVGVEQRRAMDMGELADVMHTELSAQVSQITDADSIDAYSRLFEVQTTFEAALQVTASSRSNLLFSRM